MSLKLFYYDERCVIIFLKTIQSNGIGEYKEKQGFSQWELELFIKLALNLYAHIRTVSVSSTYSSHARFIFSHFKAYWTTYKHY